MTTPLSHYGATVAVSASTSSARTALENISPFVWVVNDGTVVVFVSFGDSSITAAATDMPIPAGQGLLLRRKGGTHIAVLTASGTATVYATSVNLK